MISVTKSLLIAALSTGVESIHLRSEDGFEDGPSYLLLDLQLDGKDYTIFEKNPYQPEAKLLFKDDETDVFQEIESISMQKLYLWTTPSNFIDFKFKNADERVWVSQDTRSKLISLAELNGVKCYFYSGFRANVNKPWDIRETFKLEGTRYEIGHFSQYGPENKKSFLIDTRSRKFYEIEAIFAQKLYIGRKSDKRYIKFEVKGRPHNVLKKVWVSRDLRPKLQEFAGKNKIQFTVERNQAKEDSQVSDSGESYFEKLPYATRLAVDKDFREGHTPKTQFEYQKLQKFQQFQRYLVSDRKDTIQSTVETSEAQEDSQSYDSREDLSWYGPVLGGYEDIMGRVH